jgi:CheY-like chemotaxis protein
MSDATNDLRTKVLIAEDDAIVALDLQGMVMRLGFDVVSIAENGQTAIAAARRFQPDVILLDMVLSGAMDGIEVAREVHRHLDIPIVFCVASPDLATLSRAKDISYAGYLLKPINPDSLATTLDTVLYKYKLEKRVKLAEEKFSALAKTCELISLFKESDRALSWSWNAVSGITFPPSAPLAGITADDLIERIRSTVRSLSDSGRLASSAGRIAALLEFRNGDGVTVPFALLGMRDDETGAVNGLAVPLERGVE